MNTQIITRSLLVVAVLFQHTLLAEPPRFAAEILERFPSDNAYQAIAVDTEYFYAINNTRISKHHKRSGELLAQWDDGEALPAPLMHLDSAVVLDGELIASHSNFPRWPMTSSIEVWDSQSLQHKRSRQLGVLLGSMTWLDRIDGSWWGAFANYDIAKVGSIEPYGGSANTVVVSFDADFNVIQQWRLPAEIIAKISPMSNSGGSWGSDGYLYLTGHDDPEIYVMRPDAGQEELSWIATVDVAGLNGQGIAWDRASENNELWAILRGSREVLRIEMPIIRVE